ncbi:hypothetical protein GGI04_004260 [Coemansia thaxteri]|nr:hypothetical protein GGI04_004260 [Coemansia thaxteri]
MPGSSSSRDATHSQAPQSSRSFGLGIRRAKAATGNSIRRLFRHAGRAGSTEGQQMLEQQEEMGGGIRPTLAPIECSSSFGLHRSRSDLRAPSVRSSKSVRSIFSAARRITLRPSTLFRRHAPDPDPSPPSAAVLLAGPPASWAHDASSASDAGSPLRSPSPVQTPLPPLPVAAASEHSPPQMLGQWMRHALMPPLMPCPSADVLLLREIDELIGQLSHPRVASCIDSEPVSALVLPASACELDICGLILGLGDVASAVTAAGTCCTQSADMPSVVNLEDIVRALGNANALLALPPSFLSTGYRLDPAALVLALGAAPTSLLPPVQYLDAHYAECGDARSIPQTPSLICDIVADLPALDVAELVLGLGQVVELKLSAISSLDVERVRKSSTQTLVDSPIGSPSRHYGYIRFPQFRVALHEFDTTERETPPAAMLQRPSSDMDVDEAIQDSCEQQDGTLNINRLIAALRIPPIVVNRTLLGPLRDMLFPRLC